MQLKPLFIFIFILFIYQVNAQICAGPDSLYAQRIQADNATFIWESSDATTFTLEIGVAGFTQGAGTRLTTADTTVMVNGLLEKTLFDVYLYSTCPNGVLDTVELQIESLYQDDIGITFLDAPTTGCDLTRGADIAIQITNFGQKPQQLFDFSYSLQEVEGSVSMPFDGFYTGIVGFDSTVVTLFDVKANVELPGEYLFKIWTELADDQDPTNDTFEIVITHQPFVRTYPYSWDFEEWKGGWLIDEENSVNSSMEYGRPNSLDIPAAASGAAAWVTNLIGDYNANEKTVLISPCFDFSGMNDDPYISFALNYTGEECCDFAEAEISINGGVNWTKIGDGLNGINWYNDNVEHQWRGDGVSPGWSQVQNRLFGAAGRDSVRIRYIFQSDGTNQDGGFGIDDISIYEPYIVDAAVAVVDHQSDIECGLSTDSVIVAIENTGSTTISSFLVSYSVNGGSAVTETINRNLESEQRDTFTLATPFSSASDGNYELAVWVTVPGDGFAANDTLATYFTINGTKPLPLIEDFEGSDFPQGWNSSNNDIGIDHGSATSVYYANLNAVNSSFNLDGPNVGPISSADILMFDYRIVNNMNTATTLGAGDIILVQISEDCGVSYTTVETIDQSIHTPSLDLASWGIALTAYTGKDIKVRFSGSHSTGAYFVDIDNVNIIACPADLAIETQVTGASTSDALDGLIVVSPQNGTGPYSYLWSNDSTNDTLSNVVPGMYSVSVTDDRGCMDVLSGEELTACSSLDLVFNTTRETSVGLDGTAMVSASTGTAPYTYMWETGVETDMIYDLSMGSYSVSVTDANGCTSTGQAVIDIETSRVDIPELESLALYPNPTDQEAYLTFELTDAKQAVIQLYNAHGQLLSQIESVASRTHQFDLDTSGYPNGLYFVRISVDQQAINKRLIIQR